MAAPGNEQSLHERHGRRPRIPALIFLTLAVFLAGLVLPVLRLKEALSADEVYSVVAGVVELFRDGDWGLALLILSFSVLFPLAKLGLLLGLWFLRAPAETRRRTLRRLSLIGKWSMLDVFVVVILAGSVQFGILAGANIEPGLYVFATGVLLSMAATLVVERRARMSDGA